MVVGCGGDESDEGEDDEDDLLAEQVEIVECGPDTPASGPPSKC